MGSYIRLSRVKVDFKYHHDMIPKDADIIFGAICQELCTSAAYDAEAGVGSHSLLDKGTKVSHGPTHVMHHNVMSSLQQSLK